MLSNDQAPLFLSVFILYIALMVFIGWLASRRINKGGTAFLTGGGHLPVFLTVCTAAATLIGTGGTMGRTGQAFNTGLGVFGYAICGFITMLILAFAFAPMRSKNFLTIGEEIQYYFAGDKNVRKLVAILTFLAEVCYISSHMTGGAKYLQYITGYNPTLCKVITLLAFTIYVWLGGYLAVVWTDAIQLGIILIGFFGIFMKIIPMVNGWSEISATYIAASQPEALVPFGATNNALLISGLSLTLAAVLGEVAVSTHRHRIYTSKDAASAKKSFIITAFISLVFVFIPVFLGMMTRVIATKNGDVARLMEAGLSATLSSGDSDTMAGVTILIKDVIPNWTGQVVNEERVKSFSRTALVITLICAFVLTLFANSFISFLNNVWGALMPGLAIATLVGRFWKRVTPAAGVACLVVGTGFGICYLLIAPLKAAIAATFGGPAIPVSLVSLAVIVVVTLCTKRPELSEEEILNIVLADRADLNS